MNVFYSTAHRDHDPESDFTSSGPTPYPECARRAEAIVQTLAGDPAFAIAAPPDIDPAVLKSVHDQDYLSFLAGVYTTELPHSAERVPTTFALRGRGRRPPNIRAQAGYYGFDTTPLTPGTWRAALGAASCALAGANALLAGAPVAYALCRPPGHHAGRDFFGGYCYLNNAALAAVRLTSRGRVAILDIDYHHGNGTQEIFYDSPQVLFASIHADPAYQYPLFWGYAEERGEGEGENLNLNLPLPPNTDDDAYLNALEKALDPIARFAPAYLIISAGLDLYREDPLGDWAVSLEGIERIGERIATTKIPTLLVQEGGYCLDELGLAVRRLLGAFI
jgi:acetoin utilization deacetylase AcuC-like enzyme